MLVEIFNFFQPLISVVFHMQFLNALQSWKVLNYRAKGDTIVLGLLGFQLLLLISLKGSTLAILLGKAHGCFQYRHALISRKRHTAAAISVTAKHEI